MMKERPILFSASMVRAILDDRMSMTRRVMKPQPRAENDGTDMGWRYYQPNSKIVYAFRVDEPIDFPLAVLYACPYGCVGDRLWVRETFDDMHGSVIYRANPEDADGFPPCGSKTCHWRSPIHMPRALSRITLEITGVRVERVQDISEEDARHEGVERGRWTELATGASSVYAGSFQQLWDEINAKRGYGWAANPWVWAVSFRRVQP